MAVFVTDGDQRPALAITRSLGRKGIRVLVGTDAKRSLASSSKYCAERVLYPSPTRDPGGFYQFLVEFLKKTRVEVLIPVTDVTTYICASHKRELEQYTRVAIPDLDAFNAVSDKCSLLKRAQALGIPIPRTHFVQTAREVGAIVIQLQYPVVVKACRSRIQTHAGWQSAQVHYAYSEAELLHLYQGKEDLQHPSLIQERIVGPGIGVFALFNRGELVAVFSHKRLREKPPSGGVSTLRESIAVDSDLKEHAIRLFKPLQWHGVAMMEYKLNQKTGRPFLLEVNGRFWGSLQLAIDAGIDYPYLLYRLACEGRVEVPPVYRLGVKSRWLLGDLDHLLARLFHTNQSLHLPEAFPSRTKTLFQFLKVYEPDLYYEVLSLSDPSPFQCELSEYVKRLVSRGRGVRG